MGRQSIASAKESGNRAGLNGELAVGCFASICRNQLGDELLAFARQCPDVELGMHEMTRGALLSALGKGELALAVLPETDQPGLRSMELWQDRVMIAMHCDHPLALEPTVSPERLADEIFLVSREQHGSDMHRFLARCILPEEPVLNSVLVDLSPALLMNEVAAGKGISLVCGSHGDLISPTVSLRPVDVASASFAVRAYWLETEPDATLAAFIEILGAASG